MASDPLAAIGLSLQGRRPVVRRPLPPLRPIPVRRNALPLAALQRRAAQAAEPEPRGLFEQLGDPLTGLIPGVARLGVSVAQSGLSPFRAAYDFAQGDMSAGDALMLGVGAPIMPIAPAIAVASGHSNPTIDRYLPAQRDFGQSVNDTAMNVRHPTRYARAVEDGNIVDVVLNDLGNLSMIGGAASKALGAGARAAEAAGNTGRAASLARAESVVGRASALGGATSDAAVSVYRQGARTLGRAADAGFTRALKAEGRLGEVARTVRTRTGLHSTGEGRLGWQSLRRGNRYGNEVAEREKVAMHNVAKETGASVAEQGAALSMLNRIAQGDALIQQRVDARGLNMTPEQVRGLHTLENRPEQTFTADLQPVTRAYLDGTLDPEVQARVDAVTKGAMPTLNRLQDSAMSGEGRVGAMDPAQLGDDPIDKYVGDALIEAGLDAQVVADLMDMRLNGDTWFDLEPLFPELTDVLNMASVYPSKWRPILGQMNKANAAGDASLGTTYGLDMPVRPAGLLAAGIESPVYLPGGRSNLVDPKSFKLGQEPTNIGTRGVQGLGADRARVASEIQPYSLRALADKAGSTLRTVEFNKALLDFARNDKLLPASAMLGPELLSEIDLAADHAARAQVNRTVNGVLDTHPAGERVARRESQAYKEHYGNAVIEALAEKGYEIFAGDPVNTQVGDFDPAVAIDPAKVTPDAIVLPVGVKGRLVQNMVGKNLNVPLQILRRVNKAFKDNVLPFSIRWQLGDLVGGAFMGWAGGGIPPWELVSAMRQVKDLTPAAREAMFGNIDWTDAGLMGEGSRWFNNTETPEVLPTHNPLRKVGRGVRAYQQGSYKLNSTINRVNRQGYLLAKLQKVLDERGLNMEAIDQADGWDHPDVQEAITAAVADANKVMGKFDELTPFESRWMKNIFPFYVWSRHITMLAARTAIDHPARMVWTLRLGAYGAENADDLPPWLKGAIRIPDAVVPDALVGEGDAYLPTSFINPFNDVVNNPAWTPQGAISALSPGIKVPMASVFGLEPGKSFQQPFRPITRPYGEARNPFTDGLSATIRTFPVSREALNLAPTGSIGPLGLGPHPRYSSGRNMVDAAGNPIDTSSRGLIPLRLLGVPVPTSVEDVKNINSAANKKATHEANKAKKVVYAP